MVQIYNNYITSKCVSKCVPEINYDYGSQQLSLKWFFEYVIFNYLCCKCTHVPEETMPQQTPKKSQEKNGPDIQPKNGQIL